MTKNNAKTQTEQPTKEQREKDYEYSLERYKARGPQSYRQRCLTSKLVRK